MTGFWYTVGPTAGCPADLDFDGDVDGSDLEILANDPGLMSLADFALDFGRGGLYAVGSVGLVCWFNWLDSLNSVMIVGNVLIV